MGLTRRAPQVTYSLRPVINGVVLVVTGWNAERDYYTDERVYNNIDDALMFIRNEAATPSNT